MPSFSTTELTLLREIRSHLSSVTACAPTLLSAEEFREWQRCHPNYFLQTGVLSLWHKVAVPPGTGAVVVRKRTRTQGTPYLIFHDVPSFDAYCRSAHLLGVTAFRLLEDKLMREIQRTAASWNVPASACDELQEEMERAVGLNFKADVSTMSDEHLYGSLYSYFAKALSQKAPIVFERYGHIVDIDVLEYEAALAVADGSACVCTFVARPDEDKVDPRKLLHAIIDQMDKLCNAADSRYDLKDNLLGIVVQSDCAAGKFLSSYYASLRDWNATFRKSVWRPVAFSYQVHYAHGNGRQYLKNPSYVRACGDIAIGDMIENQIHTGRSAGYCPEALDSMRSVCDRVRQEDIWNTTLLECAGNAEQIGKALSKELRSVEGKGALARALAVYALERQKTVCLSDKRGEEYHE